MVSRSSSVIQCDMLWRQIPAQAWFMQPLFTPGPQRHTLLRSLIHSLPFVLRPSSQVRDWRHLAIWRRLHGALFHHVARQFFCRA